METLPTELKEEMAKKHAETDPRSQAYHENAARLLVQRGRNHGW
jgi:hypothetical protein